MSTVMMVHKLNNLNFMLRLYWRILGRSYWRREARWGLDFNNGDYKRCVKATVQFLGFSECLKAHFVGLSKLSTCNCSPYSLNISVGLG